MMRLVKVNKQWLMMSLICIFSSFLPAHAQSVAALFHHPNDPVAGNPKGSITVVEFFDYQCAHCSTMSKTISAVIRSNPNVRFVFKETPVNGPLAEYATRATLAAAKQGKYLQLSHALLASRYALTKQRVLSIAKANGLDIEKLTKAMFEPSITNEIKGNHQLWRNLRLRGTPTFFIGRTNTNSFNDLQYIMGEMSYQELQSAINHAR